jgi:anti-sigma factor RsiW
MPTTENDIELLHAYLDGELPTAECEGLWRRLAIERDLVAELDGLRADHALRSMVWRGLEPDEVSVARVEAEVMRASRREDIMGWVHNALRITASAAALILFGFSVGWMGHDRAHGITPLPSPNSGSSTINTASSPLGGGGSASAKVAVQIKDRTGKVIAVKEFDNMDEAQRFVRDVQAAQSAAPGGNEANGIPNQDRF